MQQAAATDLPARPPGGKRLRVVLAVAAYVLAGVPVWWWLTSLHRPPLPLDTMRAAAGAPPASLPVTVEAYALLPGGQIDVAAEQLLAALQAEAAHELGDLSGGQAVRFVATVEGPGGCASAASAPPAGADASAAAATPCLGLRSVSEGDRWWEGAGGGRQLGPEEADDWLQALIRQSGGGAEPVKGPRLGRGRAGWYTLLLLPAAAAADGGGGVSGGGNSGGGALLAGAPWVGRYRHGWALYGRDAAEAVAAGGGGSALARGIAAAAARAAAPWLQAAAGGSAAGSAPLPLSAAGAAVLSFTLLNADPSRRRVSWDFGPVEAAKVAPLVRALAPLAALSVESQVLHFTPTRAASEWSEEHAAWVTPADELPYFVDSEWALESGRAGAQQPAAHAPSAGGGAGGAGAGVAGAVVGAAALLAPHVLHFLVYVPPPARSPLLLLDAGGAPSAGNGFVIPAWGGVVVLNPVRNATAGDGDDGDSGGGGGVEEGRLLGPADLDLVAQAAAAQLRVLFGLGERPGGAGGEGGEGGEGAEGGGAPRHVASRLGGFAAWEVDALVRRRAAADAAEAGRVLRSLAAVAEELPNLEMPDLIGQQVSLALASLSEALAHSRRGAYGAASAAARAARAAADAAFLNPAVLTQLNFPDSHKLGIYMPLFLPVSVPLLQGLLREAARYRRRRREWAAAAAAAAAGAAGAAAVVAAAAGAAGGG